MPKAQAITGKKGSDMATSKNTFNVLANAKDMNERHIGAVVVTDGERVVGIFTERDILNRVVAAGRDPAKTEISTVNATAAMRC